MNSRSLVPAAVVVGLMLGTAWPASAAAIPTSGLKTWLMADTGVITVGPNVTTWQDQSGNANDATQGTLANQPTLVAGAIAGKPAIRFDGSNDFLSLPTPSTLGILSSDYEIFVVSKATSNSTAQFLTAAGTEHYEFHLDLSQGARFIPNTGANGFADLGLANAFSSKTQAQVFNYRVDANAGFIRANGVQSTDTTLSARSANNAALLLGIRTGGGLPLNGDMAEVIVYNRALTSSERVQVDQYLSQKWNGVYMEQEGGGLLTRNVAAAVNGGTPFAKDVFAGGTNPSHTIPHINDQIYGNSNSWIGASANSYAGVAFNGAYTIDKIAFGRDNLGGTMDRSLATYNLQFTRDANVLANFTNPAIWTTIGDLVYGGGFLYPNTPYLRHLWSFSAIQGVTGVRIIADVNGIAIDEIEANGIPEPATFSLAAIGTLGFVGLRAWKTRRAKRTAWV